VALVCAAHTRHYELAISRHKEPLAQALQPAGFEQRLQAGCGALAGEVFVAGDDEFVFHRVFPADQFGDVELVAVGFELQAAQYVGEVAAEFAGVDGVAPEFGDGGFAECGSFVLAQFGGDFGLATGHEDDEAGAAGEREADGIIGGGVAGV